MRLSPLLLAFALTACSCPKAPRGPAERKAIARFDVHAHVHPKRLQDAMAVYARNGVSGFANLSGGDAQTFDQNLEAASRLGGKVVVFANLDNHDFLAPGYVDRQVAFLEHAKAKGARGLKIYKALGLGYLDPEGKRVPVDDPRLDPVFEACGRLGLPVAIHSGDPKAFFKPPTPDNERYDELSAHPGWSFYGEGIPSWEEVFGEFERRVARHPKTTFIGVHFGNDPEDPAHVGELLDKYPNLYVDTAARVPEIGRMAPEKLREVFVKHRSRILFGTDFGYFQVMTLGSGDGSAPTDADADRFFQAHWRFFETAERKIAHPTPIQGRWTVDAIDLPDDVLEDVYHRNAERLLGLQPLEPVAVTR